MVQLALNEIAFKKFALIKGGNQEAYNDAIREANGCGVLPDETDPLKRTAYPLQPSVAEVLIRESNGDSIVLPGDVQLPRPDNQYDPDPSRPEYWNLDPILPGHPDFLEQLHEVVKLQIARKNGVEPTNFYGFPKIMTEGEVDYMRKISDAENEEYKLTLEDVANAVKNEYPVSIQQTFLKEMFKDLPTDFIRDLGQPFRSKKDFIGMQVRIARINAWSFEVVAPVNFMLKWHYGMSRPEEVAWLIHQKMIKDDLTLKHSELVEDIKSLGMKSRKDFTAYNKEKDNGSPTHPSYPAMHSAGSTLSMWLPALFKITPEQYEQALLVDHAVAVARTVAGVHYPQDNIAGLNIGQRIIREQLPALAAREYGYDSQKVKDRLEALSFDWKDFDSKECTINGQCVREFYNNANGVKTINQTVY